ncbi:hypothetical protein [Kitasatospora phosalacinea]|uniref:Lipoprotein n=1 Tax=Kitasatospora phosalacinea TaxID=2065 RepID=A0A9W6ULT0_9ACTN|nr:hypothetical protein [Kitasatospora phosalacinea]GLW52453.1 putative lipoprotein [Kitasatospora phosalacinea]
MRKTGRTFLAATVVVLALTATGCASKGGDGSASSSTGGTGSTGGGNSAPDGQAAALDPAALLKLVGEKTSAAKSAKVEVTTEMGTSKTAMKGAISWADGLQGEVSGNVGGAMADSLAEAGGDGSITARYLSDAMYINMGDGMAAQLGGAHWIKYGYADLAKLMGAAGDSLKNQLQNADPVSSVRALIASGKVEKTGTETVGGVKSTKYEGDLAAVDLAQAGGKGLTSEQTEALQKQFTESGITTEHIEVWISTDNLLVKKVESFDSKVGKVVSTALYTDYGSSVTTSAPSASDTVDFAELMKSAQDAS